jgi:hypothetical protein
MPKLKNVTAAELEAALMQTDDLLMILHDMHGRMEGGYVDKIENPVSHARTFAALARASASMVQALLARSAMQEQKAELEAVLRERAALSK